MGVFLGGSCPNGNYPGESFAEWELSGGNHLGGNFPGGNFHVTENFAIYHYITYLTNNKLLTN